MTGEPNMYNAFPSATICYIVRVQSEKYKIYIIFYTVKNDHSRVGTADVVVMLYILCSSRIQGISDISI